MDRRKGSQLKTLKTYFFKLVLIVAAFVFCHCRKTSSSATTLIFDSIPTSKPLNPIVNEISGIADSKINPGFLWGQEDSGTPPQLYLINHDGTVAKTIPLKGATNRDWEDMALFDNDIYIAETGDNNQTYTEYRFYKFPEPASATDTIRNIETINFTYPDGSHDAEAFLIDPATKNIYIITKRDNPSRIYKLSYPYGSLNVVTYVGSLSYNGVVSAAMSPDGKEIIVKNYTGLFYYKHSSTRSIEQTLQTSYTKLPYKLEPQGEAISFASNGTGFYTLSEKGFASAVNLYFYKRN